MSQVSNTLIQMTDSIIQKFNLNEEDFDKVQNIILKNKIPLNKHSVIDYFETNNTPLDWHMSSLQQI